MHLPPPAEMVPVTLHVIASHGGEIWTRKFGNYIIRTVQSCVGNLLVEKAGFVHFLFRLIPEPDGYGFKQIQCRWFGIKLPKLIAIDISATVIGCSTGWNVEVVFSNQLLGFLARYSGNMEVV